MKRVLVLVLSDLRHDARVRRQVAAISQSYQTTLVCFGADKSTRYETVIIKPTRLTLFRKAVASVFLLLRFHSIAHKILHNYYYLVKQFDDKRFDVIVANDIETLPLAFAFPGSPKVVFDAHEYAPRHFEDKKRWRIFFQPFNTWLCRKYIPQTAAMMTVGIGLAKEYEKNFNVKPVVITNANNYHELEASKVSDDRIRLVHHGIATPSRKLELMIQLVSLLDSRFTLDLMLLTPGFASQKTKQYLNVLKIMAAQEPRVKIVPPVSSSEVVQTIHQYDMGVFLLPPVNFNYENTLPNKLFDFIQARLGIAIGPTPEMAAIVNEYNIGVVSERFTPESLATRLNRLTAEQINDFKRNSSRAAKTLNAEVNAKNINDLLSKVLIS